MGYLDRAEAEAGIIAALAAAGRDGEAADEVRRSFEGALKKTQPWTCAQDEFAAYKAGDKASGNGATEDDRPKDNTANDDKPKDNTANHDPNAWWSMLLRDEDGKLHSNLRNASLFLIHDLAWRGRLQWDEFTLRPRMLAAPPWQPEGFESRLLDPDSDSLRTADWLQAQGLQIPPRGAWDALRRAALENPTHPVRAYLNGLQWDGKPRIDMWLIDHLGAADTPLHRAFGAQWLIAAAARIFKPGCQVDTALILEGRQGLKKSSALRILARRSEWFTDRLPDLHQKDAMAKLLGNWIIELGN